MVISNGECGTADSTLGAFASGEGDFKKFLRVTLLTLAIEFLKSVEENVTDQLTDEVENHS